jgi:VIT1/CCC1 family predicted Fe2+/Mn2+ transporter
VSDTSEARSGALTDQSSDAEHHHDHRDVSGGWLRATVFGAMDGLVSNFALIAGMAGGGSAPSTIVLAGFAGLAAGAFSMAAGEFVSVRTQNEMTAHEVAIERHEIEHNPESELAELADMYVQRGVEPQLARRVAEQISRDTDRAVRVHAMAELGVDPRQLPSPYVAAGSSLFAFSIGALIPLLPYLLGATSLWPAIIVAATGLFTAGAVVSRVTVRSWWFSGLRQLMFGAVAAAITYAIGQLVGSTVG